MTQRKLYTNGT